MKKKKLILQFDKKVISNLTKIKGGNVFVEGTISNAPDALSVCLCGPPDTTNCNTDNPPGGSDVLCALISNLPDFCMQSVERC